MVGPDGGADVAADGNGSACTEADGVTPRALCQLFSKLQQEQAATPGRQFKVSVSYVQLYREMLTDLLAEETELGTTAAGSQSLSIRDSSVPGEGVRVEGLNAYTVSSAAQAMGYFRRGAHNRAVANAATRMNAHSSRSHAVFMVSVERWGGEEGDERDGARQTQ